ncbi:OmpH family outer membrane protein [Chromohalobacter canadensis]|uniref:OmpH family outer membrane protein n=1 Tax=Chromohalobacter canadensis TaxID=141389 RepID=A0A285VR56_9GAMM|nr:OmpH family outer membrane protein [Chromohalobacter canadensis]MCK0768955.1 OmpH family outer membrane protein [Chromohalobacter canadensis]WQH07893.1 OmpH family outer membrane protein [Chromohalobacter canadensis]SOC56564.1 periplasmic chaperone for outer membrane proteins Skp [Chromohalobacter canadensis]
MRKLTGALCLGVMSVMSMPAMANEVGVIDWRQALLDSDAAQRSMNELKNQIGDKKQRAESLSQELQQLQQKLQQDGAVMSDSERNSAQQELRAKGSDFQQLRQQIQSMQQEKEQSFMQSAKPKLDRAIEQVVERHDLDLVVDRDAVVYSEDGLDVTEEVTRIFNSLN